VLNATQIGNPAITLFSEKGELKLGFIEDILEPIPIPRVARVSQVFDRPIIEDLEATFLDTIENRGVLDAVKPGMEIAVAVGSRGISNQPLFVKLLVGMLKKRGGKPFLVPSMGSHGGATGDGQRKML